MLAEIITFAYHCVCWGVNLGRELVSELNKCIDLHGFVPPSYCCQWYTLELGCLCCWFSCFSFCYSTLPSPILSIAYRHLDLKHKGEAADMLA